MPRPYIPGDILQLVINRANGYCEYCYALSSFSPDTFPTDHIDPYSLGGSSKPENLAKTCGGCNGHKSNKTHCIDPLTSQKVRLFHARTDYWPDHFQWNEDELMIVGITPIGRGTVELLQMNREGNINLRRLLKMAGLHPPTTYPKN